MSAIAAAEPTINAVTSPPVSRSAPVVRETSVFTPEVNVAEGAAAAEALAAELAKASAGGDTGEGTEEGFTLEKDPKEPKSPKDPKDPKEPKKASPEVKIDDLRALAKDGKFEEVLQSLGIDPEGLKIPSKRFAEFRKVQSEEKRKLEAQRTEVETRRAEVDKAIADVLKDTEPLAKARTLFHKGDVIGAISNAFGQDFDKVIQLAIQQQAGKDPEVIELKLREERREKEAEENRKRDEQRLAAEEQARRESAYIARLGTELTKSDDPVVAKAATKPAFVNAVFKAQLHRWDNGRGTELTPGEAAQEVIDTIRAAHLEWDEVFGPSGGASSAQTVGAGKTPQITDPAGRSLETKGTSNRTVSASRAPVVPAKAPEEMSEAELIAHYARLMAESRE